MGKKFIYPMVIYFFYVYITVRINYSKYFFYNK